MPGSEAKAAVVRRFDGSFQIESAQVDSPSGAEVLIEVRAAGLCHSDLHLASSDRGIPAPLVLGHEVAGVVRQVGNRVSGLVPGDHVLATLIQACGRCSECAAGAGYRCLRREQTLRADGQPPRLSLDGVAATQMFGLGGFAELVLAHENQVVPIPADIPFPQAAVLACSTLTGAGAVFNAPGLGPGDSVAVLGVGGVGLNAVNAARIAGASRIVAVDLSAEKLTLARRFGADEAVDASHEDPVAAVRELTGGGVHHAFDMVGLASTALQALRMTKTGGTAHLVGLHRPGSMLELDAMADVIQPQRSLRGIYMGSSTPRRDVPRYLELYRAGRLELDALIGRELTLHEINEGFGELRAGGAAARAVITSFS